MPTHLTIKNENRPNPRTATPFSFLIIVAGDMICFVVGNKDSAGVKISEKESVKQTSRSDAKKKKKMLAISLT